MVAGDPDSRRDFLVDPADEKIVLKRATDGKVGPAFYEMPKRLMPFLADPYPM